MCVVSFGFGADSEFIIHMHKGLKKDHFKCISLRVCSSVVVKYLQKRCVFICFLKDVMVSAVGGRW